MYDWGDESLNNNYGKNVLITGASSGIGRACAKELAKQGYKVIGVSRHCVESEKHLSGGGSIRMLKMDVTNEQSVEEVLGKIEEIDIAILAAGVGYAGAIGETPLAYARKQMEVNYFGVLNVCSRLIPKMHEKKKGLILIIGSVAGRVSIPMQSQYSASKYALEAYVDALRLEEEPFGIKAAIIEPGDTKTGFTDSRKTYIDETSPYYDAVKHAVGKMESDERCGVKPEVVAKAVIKMIEKDNPPAKAAVGLSYKFAIFLVKFLPDRIREKLIRNIYMK